MEKTYFVYRTPLGRVTIGSDGEQLTRFAFGIARFEGIEKASTLTNRASSEVLEYLAGKRRSFDVPIAHVGTPFQRSVWEALSAIPYGHTMTYGDLARSLGNPGAMRAVGAACAHNPLPLFVPCHRVVGANGALGGYAFGAAIKRFLLDLESGARV